MEQVRKALLVVVVAATLALGALRVAYYLTNPPQAEDRNSPKPRKHIQYQPVGPAPVYPDLWIEILPDIINLDAAPGCAIQPAQARSLLLLIESRAKSLEALRRAERRLNLVLTDAQRAYIFRFRNEYSTRISLPRAAPKHSPLLDAALELVRRRAAQSDTGYHPRERADENRPVPLIFKDLLWGILGLDLEADLRLSPDQATRIQPCLEEANLLWPRLETTQEIFRLLLTPAQKAFLERPGPGPGAGPVISQEQLLPKVLELLRKRGKVQQGAATGP